MGNQSGHSQQKVGSATLLPVGSAHNISLGVGCAIVHAVDAAEGEEVQEGEESLYVHPTISHIAQWQDVHVVDAAVGDEVQFGEESRYVHPTISHLAVGVCACS